ncbi:T4-like virus tail tube protein gp19 (plasmid) [Streptomyces sp. YIM 121038]|uniref:phage tail protein n=1 Tax=Streptomyces sp. YIM 121038 TaxID=2136401 RepID=UPI001110B356|nr:phage tail protein [Streptomyces sp. YIM 121038]QCX82320.1 T4-like virus tail tube protein gp19 [Streptomyces sp. YIM 121038]
MTIGDVCPTNIFSVELGKFQVETLMRCTVPPIEIDEIEVKQVSATGESISRKQPVPRGQSGEITITRGMDRSTQLTEWINTSLEKRKFDDARQEVGIAVYDLNKKLVRRYLLSNCWAKRYSMTDLDASSSEPATEEVVLTYEDCRIEHA